MFIITFITSIKFMHLNLPMSWEPIKGSLSLSQNKPKIYPLTLWKGLSFPCLPIQALRACKQREIEIWFCVHARVIDWSISLFETTQIVESLHHTRQSLVTPTFRAAKSHITLPHKRQPTLMNNPLSMWVLLYRFCEKIRDCKWLILQ